MSIGLQIWINFCEGDQSAFRELYDIYYSRLFVWGCKWLDGDTAFVKDQLHDFFIYLWEKRGNLSRDINPDAYLLTSFKRRLLSQWAKTKNLQNIEDLVHVSTEDADETDRYLNQFQLIQEALTKLTPAQREVIELRFLQNLSLQEIALRKNASLRTVYNLTHRAIQQLRESLGKKNIFFLW